MIYMIMYNYQFEVLNHHIYIQKFNLLKFKFAFSAVGDLLFQTNKMREIQIFTSPNYATLNSNES